ncbi:glycine cleavage H-protein-domain-containing protein [Russula earlei]|uniref:Glycine cleavage H-protein-domain-containing protein n=1 Tax=Russula earlei TaxID=71964 RepID=A0ACC0UAX4_9AGAM|nr:glycine cleavage H-protein-domain-containing protein [Russula earlei]
MHSLRYASSLSSVLRAQCGYAQRALRPVSQPLGRTIVTKRYTPDHEVIKFDDERGIGTVSITDYAQKSLGDVVFVELPEAGAEIEQGESVGAVESVKAASDIFAPVSGEVVAINEELGTQPSLLNKSPEDKGWLFQLKVTKPEELDGLLSEENYKKHCEESS